VSEDGRRIIRGRKDEAPVARSQQDLAIVIAADVLP